MSQPIQIDPYWDMLREEFIKIREAANRANKALKEPNLRDVREELSIIESLVKAIKAEVQ